MEGQMKKKVTVTWDSQVARPPLLQRMWWAKVVADEIELRRE
jgi:hypothetical protein